MAITHPSIFLCFLLPSHLLFLSYYAYGGEAADNHHHHVIGINSLLPSTVCFDSPATGLRRSAIAHRYGPCSPLGRKATTPSPTKILLQDQHRVRSLQSRISKRVPGEDSKARLPANSASSLGTGNFIVTVGLGTPKRNLPVVFDTGSDLTWIQCLPCATQCYKQRDPIFDPSKSSSYSNLSCSSTECAQLSSATGNSPDCTSSTCVYTIQYGDRSYSIGLFGRETLTLTPSDVFPNFQFGCGQDNQGLFGETAGLLGLGRDKLSLVSQSSQKFGRIFSYCLPPTASSTGYLAFGSQVGVSSSVKFTPLLTDSRGPSFYFLNLIGISVGGRKLSISPSVFTSSGTIIDSGTVITRLPPSAYAALRSAFQQSMSNYPSAQPLSLLDTCYNFTGYETVSIPKIALNFGGGANVDVDQTGILYVASVSQACLAFAENSDVGDVAILGNKQQQTLEVVYDLAKGRIGFGAPGGCSS